MTKPRTKHRTLQDGILEEARFSDNASAVKFTDRHEEDFRYVYSWNKWLAWDRRRWSLAKGDNSVGDKARIFADSLWQDATIACKQRDPLAEDWVKFAKQSNRKERIHAVIDLAKLDQRFAISHAELDNDPYLFNCLNGTLDLKSMQFRPHQQEDLITQVANVTFDEVAGCPLWLKTLGHAFHDDADLIRYVQTLFGYSLSGITDEHILPICFGEGNNGKSTIWNAFLDLMGDYSALVSQDLIMPKKDQHPTEIADMFGKRFIAVSEPEKGRHLAEARIKEWTGDRTVKARRMREDFWEFTPTHTLWLSTNHKPKITGTDLGIWRRVKLIPFTVDLADVVEVDKAFPDKLKNEYAGILNWALDGWRNYQSNGLVEPQIVTDATAEYRGAEDIVGGFIRETYIAAPENAVGVTEAFKAFLESGGKMSSRDFGVEMVKRFEKVRHSVGKYRDRWVYEGIGE